MKTLNLLLLFLLLGCGGAKTKASDSNPPMPDPYKSFQADTWVALSTSASLLDEDSNLTGAVDSKDPDFCFRLGYVLGKAAALAAQIQAVEQHWTLNDNLRQRLLTSAGMIEVVKSRPEKCDPNLQVELGKWIHEARTAVGDAIQLR